MIRINLAPPDELESPYWWVPDALIFAFVLALGVIGVNYYMGFSEKEIEKLKAEAVTLNAGTAAMQVDVQRHKELTARIDTLEQKRQALSRITESKIARYLPIVLVEHIQNLKPEGIWFARVSFVTSRKNANDAGPGAPPERGELGEALGKKPKPVQAAEPATPVGNTIEVEGHAFDNVILAEFMTALKATRNQEADPQDVRTQVFFENVDLEFTVAASLDRKIDQKIEKVSAVHFKLMLRYAERASEGPSEPAQQPVAMRALLKRL